MTQFLRLGSVHAANCASRSECDTRPRSGPDTAVKPSQEPFNASNED